MKFAEWNNLSDEEKQKTPWKQHPRMRLATLFSIIVAVVFIVVLLRIFQNRRIHVNRKPNNKEAFTMAKVFVKDGLQQPATATFKRNDFKSIIDTASGQYQISSSVTSQDSVGKSKDHDWQIKLAYTGGDWADRRSWKVMSLIINR